MRLKYKESGIQAVFCELKRGDLFKFSRGGIAHQLYIKIHNGNCVCLFEGEIHSHINKDAPVTLIDATFEPQHPCVEEMAAYFNGVTFKESPLTSIGLTKEEIEALLDEDVMGWGGEELPCHTCKHLKTGYYLSTCPLGGPGCTKSTSFYKWEPKE